MTIHYSLQRRSLILAVVLGLTLFQGLGAVECRAASSNANSSILQPVSDYPLPGKTTRWDYMSFDAARSQMFIAHLGDGAVVVINTKTKAVVATIDGIGDVHGTLVVPELDRVYASATKTNEIVAIDAATLKITVRIPAGIYPDGMAYAPEVHKLYVSDEHGKTETVIDAQSNKRIATIQLGGSVGNTQYDPVSRHIFVNVQGTSELVEIDPATDGIIQRTALPGADGNHGLLIEPTLRLAFIACEGNDKLLVMDLKTRKIASRFNVGKEPDVLAYDAGLGLLYVASESGMVSLFKVNAQGIAQAGEGFVGLNAHTLAIEPSTHEVYFPLKNVGQRPVLRVMRPSP
jgi:DNA-binding beta-propeller fold protein YncE